MTNRKQSAAKLSLAQGSDTVNATKAKLSLDPKVTNKAATGLANAVKAHALGMVKLEGGLIASVAKVASDIGKPLTANDYAATVGKALKVKFDALVKSGVIAESTAASRLSELKGATLALTNGFKPNGSESLRVFNSRVSPLLKDHKLADGRTVYVVTLLKSGVAKNAKAGRKGTAGGLIKSGKQPAREQVAPNAFMAAALILSGGQKTRAGQLVAIFQRPGFVAEFDKWAATVIPKDAAPAIPTEAVTVDA